jgi:PHD/YefM family antitoxin component YafN of YafNO toxin-antitoxin module
MPIQYVTDDIGNPTAVVVPIDEWDALLKKAYAVEPSRNDTEYLLQNEEMKKRLLEAKERSGGRTWEEVKDALDL